MPFVDVYVKLPSGRTSVLNLDPYSPVSMINEHVAKEEKVSDDMVILKYQGKVLNTEKTVQEYGIRPETILKGEVVKPQDITVSVKLPDGSSVRIKTNNTRPVSDIVQYLKKNTSIEMKKYNLKITGQTLVNRSQRLFAVGVSDESVLGLDEKSVTPSGEEASEELQESVLSSFDAAGRTVEVVFSFDTTGSMSSYLHRVRKNLKNTCQRLLRDIPNIRIGIIAHGDYCDQRNYVLRQIDLTSDADSLVQFAQKTPSTGGGDAPECYEWVLHKAKQLDWSEGSAKALVMIGDCEPHPPSYTDQKINWWTELDVLKGMGVKVYGVYCNGGSDREPKHFYEEISEQTGGCMLNLKHFDLITEMFLGVCYKEAAPEQLEAFTEELKQEGKLTEETKALMEEIADSKPSEEMEVQQETRKRYVGQPWWDVKLDSTDLSPKYTYNAEKDKWRHFTPDGGNDGADDEDDGDRDVERHDGDEEDWGAGGSSDSDEEDDED